MLWTAIVYDQVSRGTNCNLVGYVPWQDELTIVPTNLDLIIVSDGYYKI